jgi:hypothetical protein
MSRDGRLFMSGDVRSTRNRFDQGSGQSSSFALPCLDWVRHCCRDALISRNGCRAVACPEAESPRRGPNSLWVVNFNVISARPAC